MTQNPFINALAALAYIAAIASFLFYGTQLLFGPENTEDTILAPISMLSLFVFSASTMAYIVLYQPIVMFLDGKKVEATTLFLKTIAAFGGATLLIFLLQALVYH